MWLFGFISFLPTRGEMIEGYTYCLPSYVLDISSLLQHIQNMALLALSNTLRFLFPSLFGCIQFFEIRRRYTSNLPGLTTA